MKTEIKKIDPTDLIDLPKGKQRCPITGLSRAALNQLILPSVRNGWKPPVRSVKLKVLGKGHRGGCRKVLKSSLLDWMQGQYEQTLNEAESYRARHEAAAKAVTAA